VFHGPGGFHGGGGRFDQEEILGKVYDSRVIGRLPHFLKPVLRWIGVGAFGTVTRTLATLGLPYLVGVATDHIAARDIGGLNMAIYLLVAIAVAMWLGQYLETLFTSIAGQKIIYAMRTQMFDHLQRLSLGFFDTQQVGKLMSRVQNDVSQVQELVTQGLLSLLTSVLTLIGIAIIIITMDWRLGLLTLTVVPVLMAMVFVWQRYARVAFIKVRRAIAVVNSQLQEDMSGVRVIQSLSREDENMEQFDSVNKTHLDANVTAVKWEALMMPMVNIMTGISFAIVIIYGGFQYMSGGLTIGVLMAFLLYVQRFFDPVLELSMQYTQLQRAMASGHRIFEMLDIKPEIEDARDASELPPIKGEIEFRDVSFAYEDDKDVLHGISLCVEPGETVAIVGHTGSGKSSLVSLIVRFYEVQRGAILIDGHDIRTVTQESLRRQIAIVPQDPILFTGTIEENITYGDAAITHEQVEAVSKEVGAHAFISRLKKGYETEVGQRGTNLSAGQRQLICMARAMLIDPRILILDEATSNIDTHTERIMQRAVRKLARGRTCVTIAHRLSTVTGADRIIVMDHGNIIEEGSHRELLARKGHYYTLYTTLSAPDLVA
jgi:ABC-type multidrug transport system fused ATPase/permease subunit